MTDATYILARQPVKLSRRLFTIKNFSVFFSTFTVSTRFYFWKKKCKNQNKSNSDMNFTQIIRSISASSQRKLDFNNFQKTKQNSIEKKMKIQRENRECLKEILSCDCLRILLGLLSCIHMYTYATFVDTFTDIFV